ncbi:ATP-binding protein [Aureimonas glaciei]|uniref:histidine kinase n=1 Tax=Aureimonas glaciei TaxID=1776957 RepID=A0A917DGT0_9HYPH|nr:ATP-binding protein [Aureimonas glaciei]GGD34370.1 two-component sensor histidine kinase [Aureimonas glaciei]
MSGLWRRVTPRTMRGQILFIIVLAIAAVVLVGRALEDEVKEGGYIPVGDIDGTVDPALAIASLLPASTPAERALIVARARQTKVNIELVSAETAARLIARSPPLSRSERIAAFLFPPDYKLPAGGQRVAIDGRPALSLPVDDQTVLLVRNLPDTFLSDDLFGPLTYYILSFMTLLVFLSFFAVRSVTTPLARMSAELNRSDGVRKDTVFAETGTEEVAHLARALNGMRIRIREMVDTRTRMLRSVSHDLRTPLTRLRLRTERLDDGDLRQLMISDIDQINRLVEETLDYLRIDASGEEFERADIASLMQTIQADFADVGFAVRYEGPDRLAGTCKPNALVRAVTNLCDNALKFGTQATISLAREGDAIRIDVADDGPGIQADQRKTVLEPFAKLDASRAETKTAGFGLGLSIVADIVRAHGGDLELLDNHPGGLIVRLVLPSPSLAPGRR